MEEVINPIPIIGYKALTIFLVIWGSEVMNPRRIINRQLFLPRYLIRYEQIDVLRITNSESL